MTRQQIEIRLWLSIVFLSITTLECTSKVLRYDPEPNFYEWTRKYGKTYSSHTEYHIRQAIFTESAELVKRHNAGSHSYSLTLNHFADLTDEEFRKLYLPAKPQNCSATDRQRIFGTQAQVLPNAIDWRKKGVVSPVKNQGHCGSCWTFSTTGAMEAHMAINFGGKFNLSEQQLVDCAQAFNNHGCSGGLPSQAFEYIHYNPGLMTEEDYPYTAKDGKCMFNAKKAAAFVHSVVNITEHDEKSLQAAVGTYGPVSIAFDVSSDFRLYHKGVYKSTQCYSDPEHVNHAVLVVGYDTTADGEPYWIVKNSWGTSFGMDGYFLIHRGSNMCGLSDCASFPVVANRPMQ